MSEIDWSKAPEGYPIWIEDLKPNLPPCGTGWHREEEDRYVDLDGKYWAKPENNLYRAHRSPSPAWSGEGLPPVGAAVDCKCTAKTKARDWFPAEVKYISPYTVVLVDYSTEELDGEFVAHPATLLFQPRRTPEQIAADERKSEITFMASCIAHSNCRHAPTDHDIAAAAHLHYLGYRKP